MTPVDLAWAAGFLDGEAYFGLNKDGDARIQASQVVLQPLLKLQRLFGGSIRNDGKKCRLGRRDVFVWVATNNCADQCLAAIRPYLCRKHEHARLILEYRACLQLRRPRGKRSPEQSAYLAWTRSTLAYLNKNTLKTVPLIAAWSGGATTPLGEVARDRCGRFSSLELVS